MIKIPDINIDCDAIDDVAFRLKRYVTSRGIALGGMPTSRSGPARWLFVKDICGQ